VPAGDLRVGHRSILAQAGRDAEADEGRNVGAMPAQPPFEEVRAGLGADPGLCWTCLHSKLNHTRRGTTYLRCTRAEWDDRMTRYPRLPVLSCVGYEGQPR
jgi:hypothetical protein